MYGADGEGGERAYIVLSLLGIRVRWRVEGNGWNGWNGWNW
jgi:hypothetical protein